MEFLAVVLFGIGLCGGVGATTACTPTGENLALKGTATQSTQYGYLGLPSYPLNAKRSGNYFQSVCSATNGDMNPWWRLDLGASYQIGSIVVVNRADCCPERLRGAEVRVGDDVNNNNPPCGTITDLSAGSISTLCCNGMKGRYISVVITGRTEYLTLCGVEVYAGQPKAEPKVEPKEEPKVCW
ncbi:fucolectin-like [Ambystoma mexicanum]|uniref:fucolectin-like n=1 Tax=Ambystoma mexicanum TaxID=8296 RepID=UPI0037E7A65D